MAISRKLSRNGGQPARESFRSWLYRSVERRNFCKAKDKEGAAGKRSSRYQSHQGDKYATPDSTRGRVYDCPLRDDHRRLFMLCWAARASDVLITAAPAARAADT